MEENNTKGNVQSFIEQLLDVEELESKLAPHSPVVTGGPGMRVNR